MLSLNELIKGETANEEEQHRRQLQQQHYYQQQQQAAYAAQLQQQAQQPGENRNMPSTPLRPPSNATTVAGTAESRASSVGVPTASGNAMDNSHGTEATTATEVQPKDEAGVRQVPTPATSAAYSNATAPTPPLM